MKKFIITTTIQAPTEATLKYRDMEDWMLVVVGDLKTPHEDYYDKRILYLSPQAQEDMYPELSKAIGWNCIMRRNIGFVYAYQNGADIIASVDDDNIPYENWGKDVRVGTEVEVDIWKSDYGLPLDPMQLTNHKYLWHRGFPLDFIKFSKMISYHGKEKRKVLFQADLWDGDPDVDAICRIMYNPVDLKLEIKAPFMSTGYTPFNSQNTFIAREALPYYMVLPHVGRVDDIWGGYIAQHLLNTRPLFMPATTYQKRNAQSIHKNLQDEVYGYVNTSNFLNDMESFHRYLPTETMNAYNEYRLAYARINNK